jgi:hypothetical protein
MWTETFMPFLAKAGYPCYALSLRGHGGSDGREHINWHSIADYVDDVRHRRRLAGRAAGPDRPFDGRLCRPEIPGTPPGAGVALLCSVPPQGLIASQFHLMFQKPHLFLEINRIMEGEYTDTRPCAKPCSPARWTKRCWPPG